MNPTFVLNGETRVLVEVNVLQLLRTLKSEQAAGIAVAINDEVVPRSRWGEMPIAAGDRVEIVGAVQGG